MEETSCGGGGGSFSSSSSYSSSSSVITPEDVLESLMNDGTIDALRLKIINQLKSIEELRSSTIKMAEQSKVLNTPGAEKQTKRELFDALRQELETPVLEKASRSVWELILDSNGLGREISETVERVFCKLNGREPPLFPQPNADTQLTRETENKGGEARQAESKGQKEKSNSNTKKRTYVEMNVGGANGIAGKVTNEAHGKLFGPSPPAERSSKSPPSATKT